AFVLKLPKQGWTLFAAVLVFGLAGYAWQGSPEQPSSPKPELTRALESGEQMVELRNELFEQTAPKPRYMIVSDALARNGSFDDAAGALRRGLRENPEHLEAWLALGNALLGHAQGFVPPAAIEAYARASELDEDSPVPDLFLGAAYLQSGEVIKARDLWTARLERAPEDAEWRENFITRVERLDEMIANAPMLQQR
ncbi:MAG: tetratricopeptide repeat protein, partial [Marinomonas sp.]